MNRIPRSPLMVLIFLAALLVGINGFSLSSSSSPPGTTLNTFTVPKRSSVYHQNLLGELVSTDNTIVWNSLIGEADRAFRLGIQLEKNGQARKASACFHEAATLYQCFLDTASTTGEFGHVTQLPTEDCTTILAYTCLRLAFLNLDALGDPKAATRLYREGSGIDPFPSAVSFEGLGHAIQAAGGPGTTSLEEALSAYRKAHKLQPENKKILFHLAVLLERLGGFTEESEKYMEKLRREEAMYSSLVDSWGYVRWHTRKENAVGTAAVANLYRGTRCMLELALEAAMPLITSSSTTSSDTNNGGGGGTGLVCEFGVGSGRSMRMTQEILPLDIDLHGFDTFTGLPQPWGSEPKGTYSTGGQVPSMEGRVFFHKGLFGETIGPFLERAGPDAFLAYANIDCDLYSSTLDILENMHGRIIPGTILVFDEYIGHSSWRQDEFRAWRECCKRFGWKYEYLAFSLTTKQAIVRVTHV